MSTLEVLFLNDFLFVGLNTPALFCSFVFMSLLSTYTKNNLSDAVN